MANALRNGTHTVKKRYWVWLGAVVLLCVLFQILTGSRAAMNAVVSVTLPMRQFLASLCAYVPFSVGELMAAAALLALLVWLVLSVRAILRSQRRGAAALRRMIGLLCVGLTVYFAFCLLLGASYYADSFQDKSGLRAAPSSLERLYQTTLYFAEQTAVYSGQVPRDADGCFSAEIDALFAESLMIFGAAEQEYPFLKGPALAPKPLFFSTLQSRFSFTGFYFPFTGEANINVDAPRSLMPVTIAHELSHQRGVAAEDEANFVAILACATSGNPIYAYSGYLLGYIHLGNALYGKSPALQTEVFSHLTQETVADLTQNNAYWTRYEGKVSEVGNDVYDRFLKSYGQDLGIESYGAVADLLIAWYGGLPEPAAD